MVSVVGAAGRGRRVMVNTIGWCSIQYASGGVVSGSDGVQPGFPGPDADDFLEDEDEDLSVADLPGLGRGRSRDGFSPCRRDPISILTLGRKSTCIRRRGRSRCGPSGGRSLCLGDGHALNAHFGKRLFDILEFEWFYDRFDFFH